MELRASGVALRALRASLPVIAAVAAAVGVALLQVAEAATVTLNALDKRKAFILNQPLQKSGRMGRKAIRRLCW